MVGRTKGRRRIPIEKIKNESNLHVTFSKRRSGLFKKASELCTLCGIDIAIIVFSPGQKAFSFGHPNVETVIDQFLVDALIRAPSTLRRLNEEAHRSANVEELNVQLTHVLDQLQVEKRKGEELKRMMKDSAQGRWWEGPIDKLNLSQLEQLTYALDVLKKNITKQAEQIILHTPNPHFLYPPLPSVSSLPPMPPPPLPAHPMQQLLRPSSNNRPIMPQQFDVNDDWFNAIYD